MERDRIIWLAGLVDGEGSFVLGLSKRKSKKDYPILVFHPVVVIKMHEREADVLDRIHSELGFGKRYTIKGGYEYTVNEKKRISSGGESFQTTSFVDTLRICGILYPYLDIKKPQALELARSAYLLDKWAGDGGYNGNFPRLWTLCQIRDNLNPGTYRSRQRLQFTEDQIREIAIAQSGRLAKRNKKSKVGRDIIETLPEELRSYITQ